MSIILSIMGYFLSTAQSIIGKKLSIIGWGLTSCHHSSATIVAKRTGTAAIMASISYLRGLS